MSRINPSAENIMIVLNFIPENIFSKYFGKKFKTKHLALVIHLDEKFENFRNSIIQK